MNVLMKSLMPGIASCVLGLFCLGVLSVVQARQPDWIFGFGVSAKFPESTYFTGFGTSPVADHRTLGEAIQRAKSDASSALVEALRIRVQVRTTSGTTANSQQTNSAKSKDIRDDYWSQIVSSSDVNIEGINFEIYQESDRQPVFALAWIDKDKLRSHYRQKLASRLQYAAELNKRIDGLSADGDRVGAQELSWESQNVLDQLDGIAAMLELLGDGPNPKSLASAKADILARIPNSNEEKSVPRLTLWTSVGGHDVTLSNGEGMVIFARVSKPCYFHLMCRLSTGSWVVVDDRYWNMKFDAAHSGIDFALPDTFFATGPEGVDTLFAAVSLEKWPECEYSRQTIAGENYLVVAQACFPPSVLLTQGTPDSATVKTLAVVTKK
jgi:hypothetical protein